METHYFFSVYPRIDSPLLLTYSFYFCKFFRKIYIFEYNAPLFPGH